MIQVEEEGGWEMIKNNLFKNYLNLFGKSYTIGIPETKEREQRTQSNKYSWSNPQLLIERKLRGS